MAGGIVISTVALAALHDDGVDSDAFGASSTNTIGAQTHSAAFGTTLTATSMSVAIGTSGSAESKALSVGHVCNSYDRGGPRKSGQWLSYD